MRKFFIAVAKVFGLLQVYYGLAYVTSIIPMIGMMTRAASDAGVGVAATSFSGESLPYTMAGLVGTLVLTFGVAWLLLFRTQWLADKLSIPEEAISDGLAQDAIILIGIILMGLQVTIRAAPAFVAACFRPAGFGSWTLSSMLSPAIKLAFGLLLAIRPQLVLRLLGQGEKTHGKKIVIGGLVILALLILLGRGLTMHPWLQHRTTYSSGPVHHSYSEGNTVIIEKGPNTPAARDRYSVPCAGPMTNDIPDFANSNVREVVEFLQKETEKTEQSQADVLKTVPEE